VAFEKPAARSARPQRYLLTGILTVIPIWITWWVFQFFLAQLSDVGRPWVRAVAGLVRPYAPGLSERLLAPWFHFALAVLLTLAALYALGWLTTHVVGSRIIAQFDAFMDRIPLVQKIYGASKKLVTALQQKPDSVQRVVLVEFPSRDMKAVGLVMRTMIDSDSGEPLVAVYIPTTPNPTSGYLEILPLKRVVATDWSVDEAISFIISGGATGPDRVHYSKSPPSPTTL
jgi:uncharacterized membrane protein